MRDNRITLAATAVVLAIVALPGAASAQSAAAPDGGSGSWRYRASIYGYLPTLGGSSSVPGDGGSSIEVPVDKIIDSLKFTFMGSLEAHNGRWGVFTDVLYLDLGDSKQNSRDFSIGARDRVPAGTAASIDWDLKGLIWSFAGEYRVLSRPDLSLDLLGGARMARLETSVRYSITGSLGTLPPASRTGQSRHDETFWDAIVGVKGRYAFGTGQRWSVPFSLDVGAGESRLTWQAASGISYAFSWGELAFLWRHLSYEMKPGSAMDEVSFDGPMLGARFSF